jgi:hypothetical protein
VGGDLAISPDIHTSLKALGYLTVWMAGADQYGTIVASPQETDVFEVSGFNDANAPSLGPATIAEHGVILLGDGSIEPLATAFCILGHPTEYADGGLPATTGMGPQASATYGSDLYCTDASVTARSPGS